MAEPVEHIDPARLAFYVAWERCYLKYSNPVKQTEGGWWFCLSAIGLSLISLIFF